MLGLGEMDILIHSKSSTAGFPLDADGEYRIGRHPDNDIIIDDPGASRHHGLLSARDGSVFFEDLGTGNGSMISGVPIPPRTRIEVKEGDFINIGDVRLQLVEPGADESPETGLLPDGKTGILKDVSGGSGQSTIELGEESVLIGRMPFCQLQIDDPGSSRINTEIILEDSMYRLRDLGSSNGTFLNENPVKKCVLRAGDVIRVGNQKFEFSFADPGEFPGAMVTDSSSSQSDEARPVSSGCNHIAVPLIAAIVSGGAVFLWMSLKRDSSEQVGASNHGSIPAGAKGVEVAPVRVASPLVLDIPVTIEKTGNVRFSRQDIIPLPLGLRVASVEAINGQRVKRDEPLLTFELTEELRTAKKQATSALKQAGEEVAKAKSEVVKCVALLDNARKNLSIIEASFNRSEPLYRNGNLLQKEWDEILLKQAEAEAAVKLRTEEKDQTERTVVQANEKVVQVEADLGDVEARIEELTVSAGSAGVVNRLDLKEGSTVTTANSAIEVIEYEKEVKVIVAISEGDIVSIRDGLEVDVWLSRAPAEIFRGRVSFIPPQAINRNYNIEITVPNRNLHFRPGQQAMARFILESRKDAVLVPPSALVTNAGSGYQVFKVDPQSLIASSVPVRRGRDVSHQSGSYCEIFPLETDSGFSKSDWIIVRGNRAVRDGMEVVLQNPDETVKTSE